MGKASSSAAGSPRLPSLLLRVLCWIQGIYFLATGVWPLVHIESFVAVTGPKTDIWLVKTVGLLVTAIGIVLISAIWRRRITLEICLLGVLSAAGLASIDIYYSVVVDVIWDIYLLDAIPEIAFIAIWLVLYPRESQRGNA